MQRATDDLFRTGGTGFAAAKSPLHVEPNAYAFTNARTGGQINQSEWAREFWHRPLRACGIRPRKFYATRHTFISVALTVGVNIKYLAEYCGTSVAMIERHYGRFLCGQGADPLAPLIAAAGAREEQIAVHAKGAKPVTYSPRFPSCARTPLRNRVVPTGLEPVLPT
jgi:hypothetical protein